MSLTSDSDDTRFNPSPATQPGAGRPTPGTTPGTSPLRQRRRWIAIALVIVALVAAVVLLLRAV